MYGNVGVLMPVGVLVGLTTLDSNRRPETVKQHERSDESDVAARSHFALDGGPHWRVDHKPHVFNDNTVA